MKKQFEEDEYNKQLKNEQKAREEELQRREEELQQQKREQDQELQRKKIEQAKDLQRQLLLERQAMMEAEENKKKSGCSCILWVIGILILCGIISQL